MICDLIDNDNNVLRTEPKDELPPDSLAAKGWLWVERIEDRDAINPSWQRLAEPVVAVDREARTRTLTYAAQARPAAEVRAEKLAALQAYRYQREIGGTTVTIGGQPVQIRTDETSQRNVQALKQAFDAGTISSVKFFVSAGVVVEANAAVADAVFDAVVLHAQAGRNTQADHVEAILALGNDAEVIGTYDFTTGWS